MEVYACAEGWVLCRVMFTVIHVGVKRLDSERFSAHQSLNAQSDNFQDEGESRCKKCADWSINKTTKNDIVMC